MARKKAPKKQTKNLQRAYDKLRREMATLQKDYDLLRAENLDLLNSEGGTLDRLDLISRELDDAYTREANLRQKFAEFIKILSRDHSSVDLGTILAELL